MGIVTAWLKRLPKTPKALWQRCLSASTDTLLSLLAFCSALTLNAVQRKNDTDAERIHHADVLATALNIDMRYWFIPTAANFFSKVSKTRIFDAMSEAGKSDDARSAANLKKGPLAEFAENHSQRYRMVARAHPHRARATGRYHLRPGRRKQGGEPHRRVSAGLESPAVGRGRARSHGMNFGSKGKQRSSIQRLLP